MAADVIRAEEDAQHAYLDLVKDSYASIQVKTKARVNKTKERAKADDYFNQLVQVKDAALLELERLSNYNAELYQSCDFIMNKYEIR